MQAVVLRPWHIHLHRRRAETGIQASKVKLTTCESDREQMMFDITVKYHADLCYARESGISCILDRLEHLKGRTSSHRNNRSGLTVDKM